MEVLRSLDVSPKKVAEVVSQDISMTAKVLQMVNSALFGIQRQITDPTQAVVYLGSEMVRQLVFGIIAVLCKRGLSRCRFSGSSS
jgi:HD-like signal output (HDOD) protein